MLLFAGAASAANIYVNGTSGNDANNGTSWEFAKASIKNATGTVDTDGTVHIANGLYNGTNNRGIIIDRNMTIIGQSQSSTIIDGEKSGPIFMIYPNINVTIQKLTITNVTTDFDFGVIYNGGNLTVEDVTFKDNYLPQGAGAAILNIGGNLIVTHSTFTNNTAIMGGAIFNSLSNVTVTNSTFTGNKAFVGGAIINASGNFTVSGSTFTDNRAVGDPESSGGAILNTGNLTVTSSTFTNNTSAKGGAIYSEEGNATVTDSTFTYNTSTGNGGAIYNVDSSLNVTGSTFTNNTAPEGGAIQNTSSGILNVTGSTFTGNSATNGGTIINSGIVIFNFNRIVSSMPSGYVIYSPLGSVDARYNWWGTNSNPSSKVSSNVTVTPWMVLTINANPTSISSTGKSTITVDLLHDSNGVYHDPKNGHVPDGVPVTFTATKGTINPSQSNLTNGSTTSTFVAVNPGAATVAATVDNQTVPAQITIGSTKTKVTPVSDYAGTDVTLKATVTGSNINEGQVRFKVGNLTAGTVNVKNGTATMNWKVPSSWKPNKYTITAYYLGTSKYMASNGTSTFTLKPFPNVAIWRSISKGTHYYGDTIHYYITIENKGPETLSFSVYDKLPSGLKYVSSKANRGSYKSNTWNTGTLKPGQTAKLDIKATVRKVGTITVQSKITMSTWKGPIAKLTNSFDVPKVLTYAQLLKASKDIKKFYETHNNKLPKNLKIAGQTLTMPQLLKLFTTATINFSKNNKKPISVTAVAKAPYPGGAYINRELYNYVSIAKNIKSFIDKKKRAPNYAQTTLGRIPFSKLVYMYSKVVNFYGKQKRLPRYVATYKI